MDISGDFSSSGTWLVSGAKNYPGTRRAAAGIRVPVGYAGTHGSPSHNRHGPKSRGRGAAVPLSVGGSWVPI